MITSSHEMLEKLSNSTMMLLLTLSRQYITLPEIKIRNDNLQRLK